MTQGMFSFLLLCPGSEVFSGRAEHVVAPGVEGEFGVLPGHCAFVSTLSDGVVRLLDGQGEELRRFCVGGGFAEVSDDRMVILADRAVDVEEIDEAEVLDRLSAVESIEDPDQRVWLELLRSEAGAKGTSKE